MQTVTPAMDRLRDDESVVTISLGGLLASFLKIGSIGFGGGMAVIALMEKELVRDRRVLAVDEFVHGVGLGQGLGAFAVNVAAFTGYRLFGVTGALLSASVFLLPSLMLVMVLSDLYFRYHAIPALQSTVAGLGPVVVALTLSAAWSVGRRAVRSWPAAVIAISALIAGIYQVNPAWVLLSAGTTGLILHSNRQSLPKASPLGKDERPTVHSFFVAMPILKPLSVMFLTFLKIGMAFFGGGFVLVPILHQRLVTELGWLRPQEFVDGLAISSLAPGPIALLATFAGYHRAGVAGALAATVALLAPGVLLTLLLSQQYSRFQHDHRVQSFLAGVTPSVAGLILSAAPALSHGALLSWHAYAFLALSLLLLVGLQWQPAIVLGLGAAAGFFGMLP